MIGPPADGSLESIAAAQPSPNIAEPTVLAFGSSAVARVRIAAHALGRDDQGMLVRVHRHRLGGQAHAAAPRSRSPRR